MILSLFILCCFQDSGAGRALANIQEDMVKQYLLLQQFPVGTGGRGRKVVPTIMASLTMLL